MMSKLPEAWPIEGRLQFEVVLRSMVQRQGVPLSGGSTAIGNASGAMVDTCHSSCMLTTTTARRTRL